MVTGKLLQLTFDDAVQTWILEYNGEYVARICARFDVDPRRLYEVWEEKKHKGSREKAEEILNQKNLEGMPRISLQVHTPRFKVSSRSPDNPPNYQISMDI